MRKLFPLSLFLLFLLLLPEVAKADVIFPITFIFLPHFPAIILIELVIFSLSVAFLKKEISFGRITVGVIAANLVSSAVGLIFPAFKEISITLLTAYFVSVGVEFFVYNSLFKLKKIGLLGLSFLCNLGSYIFIALVTHLI